MYSKTIFGVLLLFIASVTNGNVNSAGIETTEVNQGLLPSRERTIFNCAFSKKSGIHRLRLDEKSASFDVLCDAGWTVVLNRYDNSVNFYDRTWSEYRRGFGDFQGEFFLGLDKLHALTYSRKHKATFLITEWNNETRVATYGRFRIEDEGDDFTIDASGFNGDATNGLTSNAKFCSFDRSCSNGNMPGWNNGYSNSGLFGKYPGGGEDSSSYTTFCWGQNLFNCKPISSLKMLVRPVNTYINRN